MGRLLTIKDLKVEYGVTHNIKKLEELERLGEFPKRLKLSGGITVWKSSDLEKWLRGSLHYNSNMFDLYL